MIADLIAPDYVLIAMMQWKALRFVTKVACSDLRRAFCAWACGECLLPGYESETSQILMALQQASAVFALRHDDD